MTTAKAGNSNVTTLPSPSNHADNAKLAVNKEFPIEYVTVVVGHKDKDGVRHEVVHTIDGTDVAITDYNFNIKQKHSKAKTEAGETIGFEPTGEETLKLTLSYIRAP